MKAGIEWGWRVRCAHTGCDRKVEMWSDKGLPQMAWPGSYEGGPLKGWLIKYLNGYDFRPATYGRGHLAYCPNHRAPMVEWMAQFDAWEAAANKVGKDASAAVAADGVLDRLAEWLSPADKRRKQNQVAGEARRAWEKKNRPPAPPWQKSA